MTVNALRNAVDAQNGTVPAKKLALFNNSHIIHT